MPSLKFTPRNLEKLGIILMVLLLVFRPGFVKKFSNNLIGKMLLLGAIVSVASHNKMYGLLAAFTYVVCVEMTSEGNDLPSNQTNEMSNKTNEMSNETNDMSDGQDKLSIFQQVQCEQGGSDWKVFLKSVDYECKNLDKDGFCHGVEGVVLDPSCCPPTLAKFNEFKKIPMDSITPKAKNKDIANLNLLPCQNRWLKNIQPKTSFTTYDE